MKHLILFMLLPAIGGSSFAQMKVKPNGKVVMGSEYVGEYLNNNLPMVSVYGPNGAYKGGSRITFGDAIPNQHVLHGLVFVGEYSDYDTDKLWLHGNYGTYFTHSLSETAYGYYDTNNGNRFTFNCPLYAQGFYSTSDSRLKTNINSIPNSLSLLKKLDGVTYNYGYEAMRGMSKSKQPSLANNESVESVGITKEQTEKEQAVLAAERKFEELLKKDCEKKKLGFVAQDLQKVFPELVDTDSSGFLYVDYLGLIPVIVEALKEQQNQIEEQKELIENLIKSLGKDAPILNPIVTPIAKNTFDEMQRNEPNAEAAPALMQNIPNPFNQTTEIGFFIPEKVQSANLYIYDIGGVQRKHIPISNRGKSSTTIQASSLRAGIYFYTLICDGKPVDTKQMILTE